MDEIDPRAGRLREAREAAGFETANDAAVRFAWNPNTYRANENGNAPFSFKKAKEYAQAFRVRPEWLYDGNGEAAGPAPAPAPLSPSQVGDPISLQSLKEFIAKANGASRSALPGKLRRIERQVPVVGEVAAGRWLEVTVVQQYDITEYLPIDVPGYERAQLRALRVIGPSMNLVYPEGRYVVVAHPAEAGVRDGDYVVVERFKADLVEVTLKELVVEADGRIALWPRSSHEDFQAPIYLKDGGEVDQTAPQIIGVVVADYARRVRPAGRF